MDDLECEMIERDIQANGPPMMIVPWGTDLSSASRPGGIILLKRANDVEFRYARAD